MAKVLQAKRPEASSISHALSAIRHELSMRCAYAKTRPSSTRVLRTRGRRFLLKQGLCPVERSRSTAVCALQLLLPARCALLPPPAAVREYVVAPSHHKQPRSARISGRRLSSARVHRVVCETCQLQRRWRNAKEVLHRGRRDQNAVRARVQLEPFCMDCVSTALQCAATMSREL